MGFKINAKIINELVRINQKSLREIVDMVGIRYELDRVGGLKCSICRKDEVVFACEGECGRYFCSMDAFNNWGYCPDCVMKAYPKGVAHG